MRWDHVYYAIAEEINIMDRLPYAKKWLNLVTKRIYPLRNFTNVTFPRDLVVSYAIQGIQLNMGAEIILELKMFYKGNKKTFFLPGLITTLRNRADMPLFDGEEVLPMDPPFTIFWLVQVLLIGERG